MRILIISDIHANQTALEAVLNEGIKYEAVWCLGDLVGYGPDPNECIELIRQLPQLKCIIGNHDMAALDLLDSESFNPEARTAVHWTQKELSNESHHFLQNLPEKIEINKVTLSHGSPRHPIWEYLLDSRTAAQNFDYFQTPLCFVGHTHLPVIYSMDHSDPQSSLTIPGPNSTISVPKRAILNPGSVGQPRDRDPRASFAVYDSEAGTWEYHRIPYDIQSVQHRMILAGLPERHIQRLSAGW